MHHVPALFLHPSRRLRTQALTAHADILRAEPLRTQMFFFFREIASAEQVESILGSWCMATRDQDRHVAPVAQSSWDTHVSFAPADAEAAPDASSLDRKVDKEIGEGEAEKLVLDGTQMAALLVFVQRALLDPLALHANLNPVQVPVDVSVPKIVRGKPIPTVSAAVQTRRTDSETTARAKGEGEEESETDRKARLRIGALGALRWILGAYAISSSPVLWIRLFLRVYARYSISEPWTQVTRRCTRHFIRCAALEFSVS